MKSRGLEIGHEKSAARAKENRKKIITLLEKRGPLTLPEIGELLGMVDSVVWKHAQNLLAQSRLREIGTKRRIGSRGRGAAVYELIGEDDAREELERSKRTREALSRSVFRDPLTAQFFGEYRKEAA